MAEQEFSATEHKAAEVVDELKTADEPEVEKILDEEKKGKGRSTVIEAAKARSEELVQGPDRRRDSRGREMFPWEVDAKPVDAKEAADA